MKKEHISQSIEDTYDLARAIYEETGGTATIALYGDLGSGKTCFVKGLAEAMSIAQVVTSPTFTIINEYKGEPPLFHIDLYRLNHPDEALALGFEDYLHCSGITAVEWAERAEGIFPSDTIHIHFTALDQPGHRKIVIE